MASSSPTNNNKRPREPEHDAESKDSNRPLLDGRVKRRAKKMLAWIRDPDNAKKYGFDCRWPASDLLNTISELPDERKIWNPNVALTSTKGGKGEWDHKHGDLMLSEFPTLYAAGHVHRFPELPKIFKLQEGIPDLVTLDITMPEKSGVGVYRNLREDDRFKEIPVLIITGISDDFQQFISTRRKVPPPEGYLSKPVEPEQLLGKVQELLG